MTDGDMVDPSRGLSVSRTPSPSWSNASRQRAERGAGCLQPRCAPRRCGGTQDVDFVEGARWLRICRSPVRIGRGAPFLSADV